MNKILSIIVIFLVLSLQSQAQNRTRMSDPERKGTGITLMIAGVGITTAALLETGTNYGSYVYTPSTSPSNNGTYNYVIPPIWKQTPRNLVLMVGVSLTITGLLTTIRNR